jgi:hypothetical protein
MAHTKDAIAQAQAEIDAEDGQGEDPAGKH